MADLNCHVVTFNCGRNAVDVEYFASSLFSSLQDAALPSDLIVIALQEIAPIAESFLGGNRLNPFLSKLREAVLLATSWRSGDDEGWDNVASQCVGMTGIVVFARRDVIKMIRRIEAAGVGIGLQDMGNKGAAGLRVRLESEDREDREEIIMTFVAAHLAPHEDAWERRNLDWKRICEGLVFEPVAKDAQDGALPTKSFSAEEESEPLLQQNEDAISTQNERAAKGLFDPPSYLFFAGDLNYRTSDNRPAPNDVSSWPQSLLSASNRLLANDQLTREREKHNTLHNLAEAPITFAPTYKFNSAAQLVAAKDAEIIRNLMDSSGSAAPIQKLASIVSDQSQQKGEIWAKHRVPSWCDRVLYLSTIPLQVISYSALPVQPTSDHRPVMLSCSLPRRALREEETVASPFAIRPGWKQRRTVARRSEIAAGAGVYLTCTSQGQAILASSVLGLAIMGLILGYTLGS